MNVQTIRLAEKVLRGTEKLNGTQILCMTVIGLLVVFSALLILVIYLCCSGSIFKRSKSTPKAEVQKAAPPAPAKPAAPAKTAPVKAAASAEEDDSEVIAVIMAAIAAMGAAEGRQYRLKSVRQVTRAGGSAWAQAGRAESTRPF